MLINTWKTCVSFFSSGTIAAEHEKLSVLTVYTFIIREEKNLFAVYSLGRKKMLLFLCKEFMGKSLRFFGQELIQPSKLWLYKLIFLFPIN